LTDGSQRKNGAGSARMAAPSDYVPVPKPLLDKVNFPMDIKGMSIAELKQLSYELRWETIEQVSVAVFVLVSGFCLDVFGCIFLSLPLPTPPHPCVFFLSRARSPLSALLSFSLPLSFLVFGARPPPAPPPSTHTGIGIDKNNNLPPQKTHALRFHERVGICPLHWV